MVIIMPNIHLYADDIVLMSGPEENLQKILDYCHKWCAKWMLKIGPTVDLVIFACLNFHEFLILGLFTNLEFAHFHFSSVALS